jgi:ribosomal protein L21E
LIFFLAIFYHLRLLVFRLFKSLALKPVYKSFVSRGLKTFIYAAFPILPNARERSNAFFAAIKAVLRSVSGAFGIERESERELKKSHGGQVKRSRNTRSAGRLSAAARLRSFPVGARVRIRVNPSAQRGKPNTLRFNNRVGVIAAKRGSCFEVRIRDGGTHKTLFLSNAHLETI